MTVVAVSPEVRRQAVLDAAKAFVCGPEQRNLIPAVAASLLPYGIDLLRDPAAMAALSVIGDCLRYGLTPPARAFTTLGCAE